MEEYDVDHTEANVDAPAAAMEVIGQEELIEESEVDYAEATMESEAHSLQPLFLSDLMHPRIVSVRLRWVEVTSVFMFQTLVTTIEVVGENNQELIMMRVMWMVLFMFFVPWCISYLMLPHTFFTAELNTMQNPAALARRRQNVSLRQAA